MSVSTQNNSLTTGNVQLLTSFQTLERNYGIHPGTDSCLMTAGKTLLYILLSPVLVPILLPWYIIDRCCLREREVSHQQTTVQTTSTSTQPAQSTAQAPTTTQVTQSSQRQPTPPRNPTSSTVVPPAPTTTSSSRATGQATQPSVLDDAAQALMFQAQEADNRAQEIINILRGAAPQGGFNFNQLTGEITQHAEMVQAAKNRLAQNSTEMATLNRYEQTLLAAADAIRIAHLAAAAAIRTAQGSVRPNPPPAATTTSRTTTAATRVANTSIAATTTATTTAATSRTSVAGTNERTTPQQPPRHTSAAATTSTQQAPARSTSATTAPATSATPTPSTLAVTKPAEQPRPTTSTTTPATSRAAATTPAATTSMQQAPARSTSATTAPATSATPTPSTSRAAATTPTATTKPVLSAADLNNSIALAKVTLAMAEVSAIERNLTSQEQLASSASAEQNRVVLSSMQGEWIPTLHRCLATIINEEMVATGDILESITRSKQQVDTAIFKANRVANMLHDLIDRARPSHSATVSTPAATTSVAATTATPSRPPAPTATTSVAAPVNTSAASTSTAASTAASTNSRPNAATTAATIPAASAAATVPSQLHAASVNTFADVERVAREVSSYDRATLEYYRGELLRYNQSLMTQSTAIPIATSTVDRARAVLTMVVNRLGGGHDNGRPAPTATTVAASTISNSSQASTSASAQPQPALSQMTMAQLRGSVQSSSATTKPAERPPQQTATTASVAATTTTAAQPQRPSVTTTATNTAATTVAATPAVNDNESDENLYAFLYDETPDATTTIPAVTSAATATAAQPQRSSVATIAVTTAASTAATSAATTTAAQSQRSSVATTAATNTAASTAATSAATTAVSQPPRSQASTAAASAAHPAPQPAVVGAPQNKQQFYSPNLIISQLLAAARRKMNSAKQLADAVVEHVQSARGNPSGALTIANGLNTELEQLKSAFEQTQAEFNEKVQALSGRLKAQEQASFTQFKSQFDGHIARVQAAITTIRGLTTANSALAASTPDEDNHVLSVDAVTNIRTFIARLNTDQEVYRNQPLTIQNNIRILSIYRARLREHVAALSSKTPRQPDREAGAQQLIESAGTWLERLAEMTRSIPAQPSAPPSTPRTLPPKTPPAPARFVEHAAAILGGASRKSSPPAATTRAASAAAKGIGQATAATSSSNGTTPSTGAARTTTVIPPAAAASAATTQKSGQ